MTLRKFLLAIIIALSIFNASCFAFASESESLTFKGNLTLITGDTETEVNGTKTIPMPEPFMIGLQDNHPGAIAEIFMNEGRQLERPAISVRTSKPFTVKGSALREIFFLKGTGGKVQLLSIGRNNFTIPDFTEDYYLAIDVDVTRKYGDQVIDWAELYYVKLSVEGSRPAPESKFPMFGYCTGDNVRLRESPGTKSKIIGKFNVMDGMTIFDERRVKGEIWYLVEPYTYDTEKRNLRGWIIGRYVNN